MGLAAEIVKFFHVDLDAKGQVIRTIEDFSKLRPEWEETLNLQNVFKICAHLEHHGYLIEARVLHPHPILGRAYLAPSFSERKAQYGEYDFVGHGFALIRADLGAAVRPVVVTTQDENEDIGTSFLLGNQNTLFTARHVVEGMRCVKIPDRNGNPIRARPVIVPDDPNLDVAIVVADEPLGGLPYFQCSESSPLDEVLCLGFPPIPGFQETLISDVATINAEIKSSMGRVVASGTSYLDRQRYFLINARVKGGNSGGPIVNRQGYVVGILVQTPMNPADLTQLDSLGYGVATPKGEWINLLGDGHTKVHGGVELVVENLCGGGFSTGTARKSN